MEGNLAVLIVSHLHVAEQLEKQQLSRNTRANLKRQTISYTHWTKYVAIELPSTVLERLMKLRSYPFTNLLLDPSRLDHDN